MRSIEISMFFLTLFLLSSCTDEYMDHIRRENTPISSHSGNIGENTGYLLITLPDTRALEDIINNIDTATGRIWLEIYTWTEKDTIEAVIRAKKRGVDVRIILEGNVYRTPWINNIAAEKLKNANIPFVYADNHVYNFTHIKSWIIDQRWCVSTGNWSYTTFSKNREFISCSDDPKILHDLEEIFLSDFRHVRPYFPEGLDSRIGLSPENIRPWIYQYISGAKKKILIYNQSVSDADILRILQKKADEGIIVEICQAYHDDEDTETPSGILGENIVQLSSKKPYLHAKVFLIDDSLVILGSANLTKNALDNNREILIDIGKNAEIYTTIFSLYHKDCHPPSSKQ